MVKKIDDNRFVIENFNFLSFSVVNLGVCGDNVFCVLIVILCRRMLFSWMRRMSFGIRFI